MRFNKHILSLTLLVVSLAWTLWFVFAGFGNHQDPLYWLYKYEHLEGGWMAVGTLLTGGVVVQLFGAQLLPLRIIGWLCVVAAVALPYCCLLDKAQRRANLHWLALTYFLMGYGAFQEFSPGTLSVLLLSALWVLTVRSSENNRLSIATAVIAGLAIAARFPNILVLLVLIPLWRERNLWNIPIVIITAAIVYGLGYWLVTPAAADAAMSSHDVWAMLAKLWENGGKLVGFILLAIGVIAIGKSPLNNHQSYICYLRSVFVSLVLAYFVWFAFKPMQWYNTDLTYMIAAVCLVIALVAKQKILYIGVLILSVATLGTDTAWLKLFPAVLCLLPMAAVQYEPEMKRYLFVVLIGLTSVVMVRMSTNSVGQSNLIQANTLCTISPYKHIFVRAGEQESLMQYKADYDSLVNQSSILALGQRMHLMRAVTGCRAGVYNEFWSNIFDSVYTAKYQTVIQEENPIVFCSFSPQFKTKPAYQDKQSCLENMLREEGYQVLDRSKYKYMIYVK